MKLYRKFSLVVLLLSTLLTACAESDVVDFLNVASSVTDEAAQRNAITSYEPLREPNPTGSTSPPYTPSTPTNSRDTEWDYEIKCGRPVCT